MFFFSPSLPALDWQLPSCSGPYNLQIEVQPKSHHRAHYETEGSRGAVKALSGGHPVVQVCDQHCLTVSEPAHWHSLHILHGRHQVNGPNQVNVAAPGAQLWLKLSQMILLLFMKKSSLAFLFHFSLHSLFLWHNLSTYTFNQNESVCTLWRLHHITPMQHCLLFCLCLMF